MYYISLVRIRVSLEATKLLQGIQNEEYFADDQNQLLCISTANIECNRLQFLLVDICALEIH